MNCQTFLNLLDLHREGRLTPARRAETGRHLDSCPSCRATAAPLPRPAASRAPEGFKEMLAKALKKAMEKEVTTEISPPAAWDKVDRWVLAAAGGYACLALVLYWTSPNIPSQSLEPLVAFAGEPR